MENESGKSKKTLVIVSIITLLIVVIGSAYALYTYSRAGGTNNKLIAGDIYMRYKEKSAINLSGVMPSSTYPSAASGNYFEFQIIGKNTSSNAITYNVKLAYGDTQSGKDRITDSYLVFRLVEVVNNVETPVVNNQSFNSIPGATLYTTTIPANTANEATRTFRVYARVSETVSIGTNAIYTTSEWNNLYASIKVNVDGGFTS